MEVLRAPIQRLGMSLFQALRKVLPYDNVLFSPLTASNGFLLIYIGSDGSTKLELIHALHIEQWCGSVQNEIDLEMAFRYMMAALVKSSAVRSKLTYDDPTDGRFQVFRINKIFLDESIAILPGYAERIGKLRADAVTMPFHSRPEEARQQINRFVRDGMNGRIRECFLPQDITNRTQIVLANGFCFRARWQEPFDPTETVNGTFKGDDGQAYKTQYMRKVCKLPFVQDRKMGLIFLEIPYMNNEASLLIFLPTGKGPLKEMASQLSPGVIRELYQTKRQRLVDLMLPKFAVSSNLDLIALFKVLGVETLFSDGANLSKMMGNADAFPVGLSAARHCGYFNVTESGTDADESIRQPGGSIDEDVQVPPQRRTSFFTESPVGELARNLKERLQMKTSMSGATRLKTSTTAPPLEITINRPFVFAVRHNKSGLQVCLGRLEQL